MATSHLSMKRTNNHSAQDSSSYYSESNQATFTNNENQFGFNINKPIYTLEHLATFTVSKESGILHAADGMRRLLQLEKTAGIWSQKMRLCIEGSWLLIIDYETGNIIEHFSASHIEEPTAFTSTDAMELYNNVLVFIISGGKKILPEMHIFQSQNVSAVSLVEELQSLQHEKDSSKKLAFNSQSIGLRISGEPSKAMTTVKQLSLQRNKFAKKVNRDDFSEKTCEHGENDSDIGCINDETSSILSERYERDVVMLNHCFDDIEKFISRLQHVAAISRELDIHRRNRKFKLKKDLNESLLKLNTSLPQENEFMDIFAKFKLSFNLLAKLKAHIHDPNAPELVHFLFTPLALIVEAANDAYYESQLAANVVNPLLSLEAINLLIHCVTSKETELWRSLGDAWNIPQNQWKKVDGTYHRISMDDWSPCFGTEDNAVSVSSTPIDGSQLKLQRPSAWNNSSATAIDSYNNNIVDNNSLPRQENVTGHRVEKYSAHKGALISGFNFARDFSIDLNDREVDIDSKSEEGDIVHTIHSGFEDLKIEPSNGCSLEKDVTQNSLHSHLQKERFNYQNSKIMKWSNHLIRLGAKMVVVTYPRTANNDKELNVVRGEILEVLDDKRKWWKVRNKDGVIGHVPHTIVMPYKATEYNISQPDVDSVSKTGCQRTNPSSDEYFFDSHDKANEPTSDSVEWIRAKHLGKKGEFKYF